jgi:hypothetical protein
MMCPDRQIISVYYDGELSSPGKERMEAHLAGCAKCSSILQQYGLCSGKLNGGQPAGGIAPPSSLEETKEKVWYSLLNRDDLERKPAEERPRIAVWGRRISLPLPAAAAAAVLFLILAAALLRQPGQSPARQDDVAGGFGLDVQGMVPVSDMNGVLQYLGNQDPDMVIIRLPESKSFSSAGEPTIIKAADYPRRNRER